MDGTLLGVHHLVRNENNDEAKRRKLVVGYNVVMPVAIVVW